MNAIRAPVSGAAGEQMAMLQFASTLQSTMLHAAMKQGGAEGGGAEGGGGLQGAMSAVQSMKGGDSKGGHARLGFGGAEGAQQWEEEQKARRLERKRKKKAKSQKRQDRIKAKIGELIANGMTYAQAVAQVEYIYPPESSDSESE